MTIQIGKTKKKNSMAKNKNIVAINPPENIFVFVDQK